MKSIISATYPVVPFGKKLYVLVLFMLRSEEQLTVSCQHSNYCTIYQVIYCPKEVQLICLSATVANPDELAGWIGQVYHLYFYNFFSDS